jgi:SAM-dependent methyltransferase
MKEVITTGNKHGFTYQLPAIGQDFVDFASTVGFPVLDVGAAFGVATIPALLGGAKVIAIDIHENHLNEIRNRAKDLNLLDRLETITAKFPDIDFEENSIGAIYISQVFPFLTGTEIELAAKKMHKWLIPGGKLFVVSFTPFIKHCESYLPVYEVKKAEGVKWAGYIEDLYTYSKNNPVADQLPPSINHLDYDDMLRTFSVDYRIESLEYFGDDKNALPEWIRLSGKERIGLVAIKI